MISLGTEFNEDISEEGHAAVGDSGGGVFVGGELVGLMHAIGGFEDQPGETAVYGNVTYIADLATYKSAILAAIPEPTMLPILSAAMLLVSRRRKSA